MGCVFSLATNDSVRCILCDSNIVQIKNGNIVDFFIHLEQIHQIHANLDFILASSFLNVEVLQKIVSNFEEAFGFDVGLEKVKDKSRDNNDEKIETLFSFKETLGNNTAVLENKEINVFDLQENQTNENHTMNTDSVYELDWESDTITSTDNTSFDDLLINKLDESTVLENSVTAKGNLICDTIKSNGNMDTADIIPKLTYKVEYTVGFPSQCPTCKKVLKSEQNLKIHIDRKHATSGLIHSCHECGKAFGKIWVLNAHLAESHNKGNYTCEYCGKIITFKNSLKRHMNTHTKENIFACDACGKVFTEATSLKRHYRMHTGEKPYKCDFCGKFFRQAKHLARHRKLHTGDYAFSCKICNKKFIQKGNMQSHEKKCVVKYQTKNQISQGGKLDHVLDTPKQEHVYDKSNLNLAELLLTNISNP